MLPPEGLADTTIKRKVIARIAGLRMYAGDELVSKLLTNTPHSFPRTKPMSKASRTRHSKFGRMLDTSLLMFNIKVCACCGHTTPVHSDPNVNAMLLR
jgi:hypothetical protein